MSNLLAKETSPYLLQHAGHPIHWYPWGEAAFDKARREDKPVFLSIGYSSCHWCHVMARESFEDPGIADILNQHFLSVKVDREERPDIDSVYMAVCQAMTGSGGWPCSIFMTPDKKPFFAGTYFPKTGRGGMMGLRELLLTIAARWERDRASLLQSAEQIVAYLAAEVPPSAPLVSDLPGTARSLFAGTFDPTYGGFGGPPKFPTPHNLLFLLLYSRVNDDPHAYEMVAKTLTQMRLGGIYDHIGGGFCRYATDRAFLVPHFEKMLYDNALLVTAYAAAYAMRGNQLFLETARQSADYVLREMTGAEGGFYSAQDADSEGEEGKYYLFSEQEVHLVLGHEEGERFNRHFDITKEGNFEGKNIPNRLQGGYVSHAFDEALATLYGYRKKRTALRVDDKSLTSWNALMCLALATLYRVCREPSYLMAAQKGQQFIEDKLAHQSTLSVSYREGTASGQGFLDDYACYAAALLALYDATLEEAYLRRAESVCHSAAEQFGDVEHGGFFFSGSMHEKLFLNPKETYDGALPSGNAVMGYVLVRLSRLTESPDWQKRAEAQLDFLSAEATPYPAGHSVSLLALLLWQNPPPTITAVLKSEAEKERVCEQLPLYADARLLLTPTQAYPLQDDRTTFYVCRDRHCLPPTHTLTSPTEAPLPSQ
ncbi:MAG: thioredoxin domain-containing protein [Eubacteriales bacterium]